MNLKLMEYPLTPLLQILLLLAVIILTSKGAGALSKKLGQPAVLGELLVGLILGPTALNLLHLPPFTSHEMLSETVKHLADLGVIFLMFLAGLETDLKEMKRVGTAAFLGASGGVILPFIAGTFISKYIGGFEWYESIFVGTILTATSVSISAQTLLELGQLRSKEGMTILGAAVIDDVMGIIVLSIVVAMHASGGSGAEHADPIWWVITKMVGFFAVAIALGDWLVPRLLRWASRWPGTETMFAMSIVLGLLFAFGAEAVGKVAAITGSYLVGVLISRHGDLSHQISEKLGVLAYGFFVPIFFVSIGLQADAVAALSGNVALVVWIVVASIVTKIIGSGLGVKTVKFSNMESIRVGIGMISRGEVALIVASIGLSAGVIGQDIFSVMVIMTLATTLVTPLLLRLVFPNEASKATK
ncbi:MAG TPA: cation:proton antiporter [Symbiobacteriaceae bacterium]|nr:cation:proton antiporter [Symbiobacteriaceae bacterium]